MQVCVCVYVCTMGKKEEEVIKIQVFKKFILFISNVCVYAWCIFYVELISCFISSTLSFDFLMQYFSCSMLTVFPPVLYVLQIL